MATTPSINPAHASWLSPLPGLAVAATIALGMQLLATWIAAGVFDLSRSPVSPVMLAILAGVLIRNTIGVDARLERGVAVASCAVLRIGLALVGLRLSISGLGTLGMQALPVVAGCMLTAALLLPRLARAFKVQGTLVTLLTVGTAICGCTAILAVAPAIRAKAEETGYAVTLVVAVGLVGMLLYPVLAHSLFGNDPLAAGIFLGASIHDTSQVIGAALLYSGQYLAPETMEAAAVTKLMRNLTLVAVVPLLAVMYADKTSSPAAGKRSTFGGLLPGFIVGFLCMAALRTAGDVFGSSSPDFAAAIWTPGLLLANQASEILLTVGMAAVGLTVELSGIRRLGWRPLAAGVLAAALMAAVSVLLLKIVA